MYHIFERINLNDTKGTWELKTHKTDHNHTIPIMAIKGERRKSNVFILLFPMKYNTVAIISNTHKGSVGISVEKPPGISYSMQSGIDAINKK